MFKTNFVKSCGTLTYRKMIIDDIKFLTDKNIKRRPLL